MKNKFTITLHDDSGVKQFSISQSLKKRFKTVALTSAFFVVASFCINFFQQTHILSLNDSISEVKKTNSELSFTNSDLLTQLEISNTSLEDKNEQLAALDNQLNDIEVMIGLSPNEDMEIQERLELASITSEQMEAVFQHIPNGSPIEYKGITSKYGYRDHPTLKRRAFHRGSDMRASMRTPVYATADAIVEYADWHKRSGFGRLIILSHNFGFKTYFGHLKKIDVKVGQVIKKGDLIGLTGSSGISNGPHLHYEVQFIAKALNPFNFIKWDVANYQNIFTKEKQVPWHSLITTISKQANIATIPPLSPQVLISRAN